MKKFISLFALLCLCAVTAIGAAGCLPIVDINSGKTIDLNDFQLVYADDFDTFDEEIWWSGDDGIRRGGYWDIEQVSVKNSNLVIATQYRDGKFGEGWYTGNVYTKGRKQFDSGYAEARCILPEGSGLWGTFWLQSPNMAPDKSGTEIDVVEGPYYNDPYNSRKLKNTAFHTIHAQGYGDEHVVRQSPYYEVDDIYGKYHTYGVYWDENGYRFYVDGVETWTTDFHPSTDEEYLWLSVEIAGEFGSANPSNPRNKFTWAGEIEKNGRDFVSYFCVDYVKVYQLKD